MNYLISAAIITMIIPIWGLIIHALNSMLFCMLKRITGTGFALFATNWLTFPGVIHHELSHAFFAVITGAKITEFRPFWPDKNTGSLGNIGFVARGNLLIRSVQLAFTTAGPVIMGTISSLFIIVLMKTRTFPIHMAFILAYLLFSIVIHADMSKADAHVMTKGIWVLFIAAWMICCYFGIDLTVFLSNIAQALL